METNNNNYSNYISYPMDEPGFVGVTSHHIKKGSKKRAMEGSGLTKNRKPIIVMDRMSYDAKDWQLEFDWKELSFMGLKKLKP